MRKLKSLQSMNLHQNCRQELVSRDPIMRMERAWIDCGFGQGMLKQTQLEQQEALQRLGVRQRGAMEACCVQWWSGYTDAGEYS